MGAVVPWDSKNQFYPFLRYLGAALEHGELPLWNPYHFSGHPAVADPQSLLFTPTMLLFGWLVPQPSMELFDAVVFAHLLPGALAFIPLFRRRRLAPAWRSGGGPDLHPGRLGHGAPSSIPASSSPTAISLSPLAPRGGAVAPLLWLRGALCSHSRPDDGGRDQVAFLERARSWWPSSSTRQARSTTPVAYLKQRLGMLFVMALVGGALLAVPEHPDDPVPRHSNRPPSASASRPWAPCPRKASPRCCSATSSEPCAGPTITGGRTTRAWAAAPGRPGDKLPVRGHGAALLLLWHGIAGGRILAREFRFFLVLGIVALFYAFGRYTPVFELIFDYVPGSISTAGPPTPPS
jgi:hypothetical protein